MSVIIMLALCFVGSAVATWRRWPWECHVIVPSLLGFLLGGSL